jgi:hypothetical protein
MPAAPGVFALLGADENAEPYLSRTPNLRNRLRRLLDPRPDQTRRLRLAQSISRIEYSLTGSDFEALLLLYGASILAFGERAHKRLHLRAPVLLRMAMENPYPRVYVTNKVTNKAAANLFGPWQSRVSAENFLESMLNLFELRRCVEELHPDPTFPGCVYSEMKKCMAPCFKGCTDERYAQEAAAVYAFLATHGQSLIDHLTRDRDDASTFLNFERAAEIHTRLTRVESAAALMPAAIHSLDRLNGVVLQPSAEPDHISIFLLTQGRLAGPVHYSVAGMRHQNEQSGSSSLFSHPMALQPVPLNEAGAPSVKLAARDELEARLDDTVTSLQALAEQTRGSSQQTTDHLCLFARWYYRPQAKRIGEVCFAQPDGELPRKAILRAISRVYRGSISGAVSDMVSNSAVSSKDTSATSGPSGQSSA